MATMLVRLQFASQTGNFYWFRGGFFNEGRDLPSFGDGALVPQPDISSLLAGCPGTLLAGEYVGAYEVPVNLTLRSIRVNPWMRDSTYDLLEDILIDISSYLGLFFAEWFDVLYTPSKGDALPTEQQAPFDNAVDCGESGLVWLPDFEDFPEGLTEILVAASVSQSGAMLVPAWAWLYTGGTPDTSMIRLIGQQYLIEPYPQPYIDVRWWPGPFSGNLYRFWGSYDIRYPQYNFRGWNGLPGAIDVYTGVASSEQEGFNIAVSVNTVIIPFLSPSVYGSTVNVSIHRGPSAIPSYVFAPPPPPAYVPSIIPTIVGGALLLNGVPEYAIGACFRLFFDNLNLARGCRALGAGGNKPLGASVSRPFGSTV